MPITWGSNYSLLFIDSPVGTGFSFTEDEEKYVTDEDMVSLNSVHSSSFAHPSIKLINFRPILF